MTSTRTIFKRSLNGAGIKKARLTLAFHHRIGINYGLWIRFLRCQKTVPSETTVRLVAKIRHSGKAVKVPFFPLDFPDEVDFRLSEGVDLHALRHFSYVIHIHGILPWSFRFFFDR